jgi:hypothetical protein
MTKKVISISSEKEIIYIADTIVNSDKFKKWVDFLIKADPFLLYS